MEYLGTQTLPLAALERYPGNPRHGDLPAIRASVREFGGQYRGLVVRVAGPDGDLPRPVILAGNHTSMALAAEGFVGARADLVSCTDTEARMINLADNRLAERGGYDDGELLASLQELVAAGVDDFSATGWGDHDLVRLLNGGALPDEFPEFDEGAAGGVRPLMVTCPECSAVFDAKAVPFD